MNKASNKAVAAMRKAVKKALDAEWNLRVDDVQVHDDLSVTFRKGFFYTFGQTAEQFKEMVLAALPDGTLSIDCGEVWKAFKGGAKVRAQSHWWVKVRLPLADRLQAIDAMKGGGGAS